MNFKAWNMNKGLKRIWIIGTVFLFLIPFFTGGEIFGIEIGLSSIAQLVTYFVISIGLWWGLLYLGF